MLTRDEVIWGFRLCLGREPENEGTIEAHSKFENLKDLRDALLSSKEFATYLKSNDRILAVFGSIHPIINYNRPVYIFIHIEKTGGSTLRNIISSNFHSTRISAPRLTDLHKLPLSYLSELDFISGHFDYFSASLVPRVNRYFISLFRDPKERLISFYRFHRAHSPIGEHAQHRFVRIANEHDIIGFFRRPEVRTSPRVNNTYLRTFGTCIFSDLDEQSDYKVDIPSALESAKSRVRNLNCLGLTSRMDESTKLICSKLAFTIPDEIQSRHRTDDLSKSDSSFSAVEPVVMSPELEETLGELIKYDCEIFSTATEEFDKRLRNSYEP